VPGDDRVGIDEHQILASLGPEAMPGGPIAADPCPGPDPSSLGSLQDTRLVAKGQDLKLQRGPCSVQTLDSSVTSCDLRRTIHGSGR